MSAVSAPRPQSHLCSWRNCMYTFPCIPENPSKPKCTCPRQSDEWFCSDECKDLRDEELKRNKVVSAPSLTSPPLVAATAAPTHASTVTTHQQQNSAGECLFIFFDLETTGLDVEIAEVIEMGARVVHVEDHDTSLPNDLPDAFSTLVKLDQLSEVPPEVTKIHGITTQQVTAQGVPTYKEMWQKFDAWIRQWMTFYSKRRVVLIAHNCFNYDRLIVQRACKQHDLKIKAYIQFSDSMLAISKVYGDTYSKASGKKGYSLLALADVLLPKTWGCVKMENKQQHRALSDVDLLLKLVRKGLPPVKSRTGEAAFFDEVVKMAQPKIHQD